ncbi:MAG: CbiX/SirB N-terminal domain-containing protein [Chlamydiota bacterium]|nr:CbiX/SirB N-terminal domain-containing protein [Chlamydiota bacterium]
MKTVVVLVMHGMVPKDFPKEDKLEWLGLHGKMLRQGPLDDIEQKRHDELETKMREWPRTSANDPFHTASQELAGHLEGISTYPVYLGFNEFCAPSMEQALDEAVANQPKTVIVITPMLTPGGNHSEKDIPDAIALYRDKHPEIDFIYAWPYDMAHVGSFLSEQITHILRKQN